MFLIGAFKLCDVCVMGYRQHCFFFKLSATEFVGSVPTNLEMLHILSRSNLSLMCSLVYSQWCLRRTRLFLVHCHYLILLEKFGFTLVLPGIKPRTSSTNAHSFNPSHPSAKFLYVRLM